MPKKQLNASRNLQLLLCGWTSSLALNSGRAGADLKEVEDKQVTGRNRKKGSYFFEKALISHDAS